MTGTLSPADFPPGARERAGTLVAFALAASPHRRRKHWPFVVACVDDDRARIRLRADVADDLAHAGVNPDLVRQLRSRTVPAGHVLLWLVSEGAVDERVTGVALWALDIDGAIRRARAGA
jgi:hypothetical protein